MPIGFESSFVSWTAHWRQLGPAQRGAESSTFCSTTIVLLSVAPRLEAGREHRRDRRCEWEFGPAQKADPCSAHALPRFSAQRSNRPRKRHQPGPPPSGTL